MTQTRTTHGSASRSGQEELALLWRPRGVTTVPQHRVPPLPDELQKWIARTCAAVVEGSLPGVRPAKSNCFQWCGRGRWSSCIAGRGSIPPETVRCVASRRCGGLEPSPGVLEASAVVEGSQRFQAVALQLRRVRDAWQVTAVEIR